MFTTPAVIARRAHTRVLHLAEHAPWAHVVHDALTTLRSLKPAPG